MAKAGFDYQEQDRFTIIQGNKLYISGPGQYNYRYYCDLSELSRRREYSVVVQIDDKKYACPATVQNILVIGERGVENRIDLEQKIISGRAFIYAWKYKNFLLLQPLNYPAVVRCDTRTGACTYFREYINVFVKDRGGRKITGGAYLHCGRLYLASPTDNQLWTLDIERGEVQVITVPVRSRCGCNALVVHQDALWLLPYMGTAIVYWNLRTGAVREYEGVPDGFACSGPDGRQTCGEQPFSTMAFYGDDIYLAPMHANMYLRFHMHSGQFEQWKPPLGNLAERNVFFPWWKPEDKEGWLGIYSNVERRLYAVNMKTEESKEIEIKFDREELEAHEAGFSVCSEALPHACMENALNPLERFLDSVTVGNSFDKYIKTQD